MSKGLTITDKDYAQWVEGTLPTIEEIEARSGEMTKELRPLQNSLFTLHLKGAGASKKTHVCFPKNIPLFLKKHTYDFPKTYL